MTSITERYPAGRAVRSIELSEVRARGIVARLRAESGTYHDPDAYALEEAINNAYGDQIEDLGDQAYALLSCGHAVPLWDNKPHPAIGDKVECDRSGRCMERDSKVVALLGKTFHVGKSALFRRDRERIERMLIHPLDWDMGSDGW
jgi:hypothetical protein